jgi:hypothetical protein
MELILMDAQHNELSSSDPQTVMELSDEELQAWSMQAISEAQDLNNSDPYLVL